MQRIVDFSEAYDRHAGDVFRAAVDVLRDRALAEEVTQDVFLAFWRGSGYDAARGPLGPYLRRLARNRAVDVWRRGRTGAAVANKLEHLAVVADRARPAVLDPCAGAEASARAEAARAAVRDLPDDQRRALVLTYWGGLTVAEAAKELDIPLGTVKSRIRLGLRRLARDSDLAAAA